MSSSRVERPPEVLINSEKLVNVDIDAINQMVLSRPFDDSIFYTVFTMIVVIGALFVFSAPVFLHFLALIPITMLHNTLLYNHSKRNVSEYRMSNITVNGVPVKAKNANDVIDEISKLHDLNN